MPESRCTSTSFTSDARLAPVPNRQPRRAARALAACAITAGLGLGAAPAASTANSATPTRDTAATACNPARNGWCPSLAYLQPVTSIAPVVGGSPLTAGSSGVKVAAIQRALGMGSRNEEFDAATIAKVRAFQARKKLPVTGVVNAATWRAAGIALPWTIDAWQTTVAVPQNATRTQRVEAMVAFAAKQVGSSYVWGGAGYAKLGYDCSGLVLQSLYAAGIDPQPVSVLAHQSPGYITTEHLYHHKGIERVPLAQRQRGDLIFWGRKGVTTHVAIYLGRGRLLEAVEPRVHFGTYAYTRGRVTAMPYVLRPLADR